MKNELKKTTKISLIVLLVGILLLVVGLCSGGKLNYAIDIKNKKMYMPKDGEDSFVSKTVEVDAFNELEMDIDVADVEIKQGEGYSVSYNLEEWNVPAVEVKDQKLTIANTDKQTARIGLQFDIFGFHIGPFSWDNEQNKITITVPKDTELDDLKLKVSTGNICIDQIQITDYIIEAESGEMVLSNTELGTGSILAEYGNVELKKVEGKECTLNMESGSGSFEDLKLEKLDLNAEYGNVEFDKAEILNLILINSSGEVILNGFTGDSLDIFAEYGNISIDETTANNLKLTCESGETNIKLLGNLEDYNLDIEVESGTLEINGDEQGEKVKRETGKSKNITIANEYGNVNLEIR